MNEEQAWALEAQQGSDEAFTKLVETYQTPVFNLCYRMLGEPELAEDAAQETFLRAYQHLHRYDQKRPFATWLLSIAAHYCIDKLRRRKFSMFSMDAEDEEGNTFEIADPDSPNPRSGIHQRADANPGPIHAQRPGRHRPRRHHHEILVRLFRDRDCRVVAADGQRGQEPPASRPQRTGGYVAGGGNPRPCRKENL